MLAPVSGLSDAPACLGPVGGQIIYSLGVAGVGDEPHVQVSVCGCKVMFCLVNGDRRTDKKSFCLVDGDDRQNKVWEVLSPPHPGGCGYGKGCCLSVYGVQQTY
ncbi:hypothetical protein I3842_05G097800 [Carya illinoinensis]|uniref:Uncharacterized protein n=1 Tax=Carya illinoinensis TaxID=32201 RepID=A0A922JLN2_CARIL|nr:hypothetical protein I3842_05G097800 [Carya illinoinensis]